MYNRVSIIVTTIVIASILAIIIPSYSVAKEVNIVNNTIPYSQQDINPVEFAELLVELVENTNGETLEFLANLFGIPYSSSLNNEYVKDQIIIYITRNYEILKDITIIDGKMSHSLDVGGETFSVLSALSMKQEFDKEDGSKYTQYIFLSCDVSLGSYKIKTDAFIMKIDRKDPETLSLSDMEFMASGGIVMDWGNFVFSCDKIFFYPEKLQAVLYDVGVYSPGVAEVVVKCSEAKVISKDEILLIGVTLCGDDNLEHPHYRLKMDKVWLYPDMDSGSLKGIFATHLVFIVGQTPLFYIPLWFKLGFGTGIRVNMKYERNLGFYIQTAIPINILDFSNTLLVDYYQKMGFYASLSEELSFTPFFNIDVSIAYDRALKYIGKTSLHWGEITNYVDTNHDGKEEESYNSFRYYVNINAPLTLYEGRYLRNGWSQNTTRRGMSFFDALFSAGNGGFLSLLNDYINYGFIGIHSNFMSVSDPNFKEQFIDFPRSHTFIFSKKLIYNEKIISVYTPDSPGLSSTAMKTDFSFIVSSRGFKASIQADALWSFRSVYGKLNPYDVLNYYAIQPKTVLLPSIKVDYKSSISNNIINDIARAVDMIFFPEKEFTSLDDLLPFIILSLPIDYKLSYSYSSSIDYVEEDTAIKDPDEISKSDLKPFGKLRSKIDQGLFTFSLDMPFTLKYDFFTMKTGFYYNISYHYHKTKRDIDSTPEEIQARDDERTRSEWLWGTFWSLDFNLFKDYQYLNLNFGVKIAYDRSGNFDDLAYQIGLKKSEYGTSEFVDVGETIDFSKIYLEFFHVKIGLKGVSIPFELNSEDKQRLGEVINLMGVNGESMNLVIDESYLLSEKLPKYYELTIQGYFFDSWELNFIYKEKNKPDMMDYRAGGRISAIKFYNVPSLFGGRGYSLNASSEYKLKTEKLVTNHLYIDDIRFKVDYIHFFGKSGYKKDSLTISFMIDFQIMPYWGFSFLYEIENKDLWRYKIFGHKQPENDSPRGFFEDIGYALSFWDVSKLQKSFWKMKTLALYIYHDLAEWRLTGSIQLNTRFNSEHIIIEPLIAITIQFTDFPQFSGGYYGDGYIDNYEYNYDRF